MTGCFVTGTDTGIGKTTVATAIALGFAAQDLRVSPMKPVQTGCIDGLAPDLQLVLKALDLPFREEMLPYAFDEPCSPHLAAGRAGADIQLSVIREAFSALQASHDRVVVEGAGGIMVPLNHEHMMLDLMKALDLPVVLTARPTLGTLNHTLLSLQALRLADLTVAGFVTVDTEPAEWGWIEEDNLKTLIQTGETTHLGHIPYYEDVHEHLEYLRPAGDHLVSILDPT